MPPISYSFSISDGSSWMYFPSADSDVIRPSCVRICSASRIGARLMPRRSERMTSFLLAGSEFAVKYATLDELDNLAAVCLAFERVHDFSFEGHMTKGS